MLDMHRLVVLQAVAREGSLSAAARVLGYSQPAVSHHIARLEAETAATLVVRSSRRIVLTEAGRVLVHHADHLLARAHAPLRTSSTRSSDGAPPRCAWQRSQARWLRSWPTRWRVLPPSIPRSRPRSSSTSRPRRSRRYAPATSMSRCSSNTQRNGCPPTPDLERIPLCSDHLVAVLPIGHPGAGADRVSLARLSDERWIAGCARCSAHLMHACQRAGFAPDVRVSTDDYVAVQRLVAAGIGVSLLPALSITAARREDVAVVALDEAQPRDVFALITAGRCPPGLRRAVDALQARRRPVADA